jgi:hypothetical protein
MEMVSDLAVEQSEALTVAASIRQLICNKDRSGTFEDEQEEDEEEDEYVLKVGMVCFSASGRYFGSEPKEIQQARKWAKVKFRVSHSKMWR